MLAPTKLERSQTVGRVGPRGLRAWGLFVRPSRTLTGGAMVILGKENGTNGRVPVVTSL